MPIKPRTGRVPHAPTRATKMTPTKSRATKARATTVKPTQTSPLIILTGASGAGKSTVADVLKKEHPIPLSRFVTCTTRAKRPGEKQHQDYHFLTRAAFEARIAKGDFFEWANVYGNYYGSSKSDMAKQLKKKAPTLLVLDVFGMKTVKTLYPNTLVIFLDVPRDHLKGRLEDRSTDPKDLKTRLAKIAKEQGFKRFADLVIENKQGKLPATIRQVTKAISHFLKSSDTPRATS